MVSMHDDRAKNVVFNLRQVGAVMHEALCLSVFGANVLLSMRQGSLIAAPENQVQGGNFIGWKPFVSLRAWLIVCAN